MAADDVPADLKGLQDALVNTENVEQFLHEMAVLAAQAVGSDSSCAMTMGHGPRPVTVACTDPVAAKVDAVQYELDTGPCLHALRAGQVVHIEDTAGKAHWPEFERRAASLGIQSCLALPLPLRSKGPRIGALNLYARHARAFGEAEAQRASDFAENASGALALAIRLASHAALIDQLRSSMASRTVIDQALGIIMGREQCTQARAFDILRSASQHRNVKLRDIAGAIITSVSGEPPQPAPVFEADLYRVAVHAGNRFAAVGLLGRPAIGISMLAERPVIMDLLLLRIRKSRRNTRVYIHQAIDTGQGQHSVYGRCAHGQAHFTPAGLGPPEGTG